MRNSNRKGGALYFLVFLHGAMVMAMFGLAMMSNYENQLLDNIIARAVTPEMDEQTKALSLLNVTHSLITPRAELFKGGGRSNVRERIFTSADVHLMDGKGACGSFAGVLTRLLQRSGIEARLAQMKCGDEWGCHINLEAKINGRFVALDPLYNLAFEKKNGELADYHEVGSDWQYYRSQVPENYYSAYQYEDVRYTNWQKIPVVMPFAEKLLIALLGDKAKTFSLRSYVLNIYSTYLALLVFIYLLLIFVTYRAVRTK